jgi:hypothetical protein
MEERPNRNLCLVGRPDVVVADAMFQERLKKAVWVVQP